MHGDTPLVGTPRPPAVGARAMVATSQTTATAAGLRILRRGGNAADAAIAAAAVLCVTEPLATGPGGDLFALVYAGGHAEAIDAAGPAPQRIEGSLVPERYGARSVDVPGAVAGWALLAERYGRLGLDACLADAIEIAQAGFAVGPRCAGSWATAPNVPDGFPRAPRPGELVRLPELGETLATIAREGPAGFYGGRVGEAICAASWLEADDLDGFEARVTEPLSVDYEGHTVLELGPPTQGVAALEGLALLAHTGQTLGDQINCCRLALEDAFREVRDGADVRRLLEPDVVARRVHEQCRLVHEPAGGTVYLCAVDEDGMAVSLVQSLFERFGSGVVAPGTGVVLNNRCFGSAVSGEVVPGRRPYHTIIPGMLLRDGDLVGPFGLMGGFIQAQAHLQLVHGMLHDGLDPQTALDRPRFRVGGERVRLEYGLWDRAEEVSRLGLEPVLEPDLYLFGGGQAVLRTPEGTLIGGSDSRKDGYAGGW
ncbi:MAG TPA: gamma-glutamyltransferase [Solirubrobacteraceae bacterium]|nr:gamma-glutamyltransferase [Solirubrobacteraceae bacterium]